MSHVDNHKEQGGSRWVVNGTLEITDKGELIINGLPLGRSIHQPDSEATTVDELKADFNALLLKLKQSGLMDQD